ncbi:MAG: GIY-YIG nuclease family protein [Dehalococcoidales bacterium]|nr:GIY-YIG nuclease family protein [Dehalococcoidales bacterium]
MFRRKNKNVCGYWNCSKRIPDDQFLCAEHYEVWQDGLIDRCPKCTRFKDIAYQVCLDCYFGRPVASYKPPVEIPAREKEYKVAYSDAWIDGYHRPDRFFVYLLEVDDGTLYIGHTRDLSKQLSEYRKQGKSTNPGKTFKLQYVQIVATEEAAELRESELRRLILTNPDQIQAMISDFRSHMRKLGYG